MYFTTAAAVLLLTNAPYVHGRCDVTPDYTGAVVIPADWTEIPRDAFRECDALKSVVIPKEISIIHNFAFFVSVYLKKVEFENGSQLHTIGDSAFRHTTFKMIKIPSSVTLIEDDAFLSFDLEDIQFENGSQLHTIGSEAFAHNRFERIKIPKSVTLIERKAFFMSDLEEVEFENGSRLREIG
eukprot:CAMPEP_0194305154 /NCGR_PEP_ID=MMETSP0171-20130528/2652_1 /TAXON_ID=218684 /ORGANISM="Corethron pennatum, Strain L29A3" /LENGTH=182 /DNA_ID=CAMNT_0039056591 /DNA_START=79 /DNA_END=624 /DNA_ORIENTATION=+